MIIQAVLGVTLGLLLATVAATSAAGAHRNREVGPLGLFGVTLPYVVVVVAWLAQGGISVLVLLTLAVLAVLPLVLAGFPAFAWVPDPLPRWGRVVAGIGLVAVLLIAAGQTLSLLGRVNPAAAVIAVGVAGALTGLAAGVRGAVRVGVWVFWVLVVLALLVLGAGLYLGSLADLADPVIETPGVPIGGLVGLAVAVAAVGVVDPATHRFTAGATTRARWLTIGLVAAVVLVFVAGLMMYQGGSLLAPSLEFFVIPANLGFVPGGLVVALAVVALMLTAAIGNVVAAAADAPVPSGGPSDLRGSAAVAGLVVGVAVVIAVVGPRTEQVMIATALLCAAVAGAAVAGDGRPAGARTIAAWSGLALAVVIGAVLCLAGEFGFGWPAAAGICAVALITAAVAAAAGRTASGTADVAAPDAPAETR